MNYISVDVETTGLVPGFNSLLSVGAIDIESKRTFQYIISHTTSFNSRLVWDKSTKEWWHEQYDASVRIRKLYDIQHHSAMPPTSYNQNHKECAEHFKEWLDYFQGDKFFVAWPASFDYPYIQHLFLNEGIENPFNYRTIDVKSYACGKLDIPFEMGHNAIAEKYPWLYEEPKYPHDALSDAITQANVFERLLKGEFY